MVDVLSVLRKLEPLIPDDANSWRRSLPLLDPETRLLLEKHIIATAQRLLGDWDRELLLPPPPKSKAGGKLELGSVVYDKTLYPFGLEPHELLQGLGIYGRSGAGKTNVVFTLLRQLEKLGIPFLFLDWKRTCRHLLPSLKRPVRLYTPGRSLAPFRFNPLIPPPGQEQLAHITQVVDLLSAAYTLGDGAKSLLQGVLRQAYKDSDSWPTLEDALTILEDKDTTGRASGWKASALRALQSLTFPDLLDRREDDQSALLERLLQTSTVLELNGMDENAKKFLIPSLMLWLFGYRLQTRDRERLRLVIIVEEAHHVLFRQESKAQESVMNKLLRQCRELGMGMVVVDQHPHLISSAALGNAYATICLNLKDPTDINKAAAMSQLRDDEKRYLTMLPTGCGIVKLQDRWHRPFLVRFPHARVEKGLMTDAALGSVLEQQRTDSATFWPVTPSASQDRRIRFADAALSSDAYRLLLDTVAHPHDGVRAHYQRLGFSMDKGNRLKNDLLRTGFLTSALIPIGRTRRTILRPSREANAALRLGVSATFGSVEHEFWKHHYAEKFREAGYAVDLEAPRHDGRVDVLASRRDERIAIEVETGKSDFLMNVRNGLRSRFDTILVVATTKEAQAKVERELARAGLLLKGRLLVVLRDGYAPQHDQGAVAA